MDVYIVVMILGLILRVNCEKQNENRQRVKRHVPGREDCRLPNGYIINAYLVYLLAFAMVAMLATIIYLSIALVKSKRKMFLNNTMSAHTVEEANSQFRQNDYNSPQYKPFDNIDKYKSCGSNLTVNSGIVEINQNSNPDSPTQTNEIKIYVTKPQMSVPLMHKQQMDELIRVLKRSQKSVSTSMKELDALQNEKNEIENTQDEKDNNKELEKLQMKENKDKIAKVKDEDLPEKDKETKKESDKDSIKKEEIPKTKDIVNNPALTDKIVHYDLEQLLSNKKSSEEIDGAPLYDCPPKEYVNNCEHMEEIVHYDLVPLPTSTKKTLEDIQSAPLYDCLPKEPANSSEVTVDVGDYDIVPRPVRTRIRSEEVEYVPLYDCPQNAKKVLILDADTDYLMPISTKTSATTSYINARSSHGSI